MSFSANNIFPAIELPEKPSKEAESLALSLTEASRKKNPTAGDVPSWVARHLLALNINSLDEARKFFSGASKVHNATLLPQLERVLDKLVELCGEKAKVAVHGDYDVDGITGTAILERGLTRAGLEVKWILPSRFLGGYGLQSTVVEELAAQGYRWLITVDTGITAVKEIETATRCGMKVIVLDHHREGPQLPEAWALVAPHLKDSTYPNPDLCGAGLAFKLVEALHRKLGLGDASEYLELFCLGTLADMVSVTGENRALLKKAMPLLANSSLPGVRALVQSLELDTHWCASGQTQVSTRDILFRLTPILNAPGRLDTPDPAFRLLTVTDGNRGRELADELTRLNERRKDIEREVSKKAIAMVREIPDLEERRVLVVAGKDWHLGVLGIVAARLVETFHMPAAVISLDKEGRGHASARGVAGFDWHALLSDHQEMMDRWGGHPMAAGFSLAAEKVSAFAESALAWARDCSFSPSEARDFRPDYSLESGGAGEEIMTWMQWLEPFGPGNESPLFCMDGLKLDRECRAVGDGSHLLAVFLDGRQRIETIGFGLGSLARAMREHDGSFRVVFSPGWNTFRGTRKLQFHLKAVHPQN